MILTSLQKLPNNVGDLGKIIIATGFEWLPKVQKSPNLVTLIQMPTSLRGPCSHLDHCFVSSTILACQSDYAEAHHQPPVTFISDNGSKLLTRWPAR